MSAFQSEYQTSFNETDWLSTLNANRKNGLAKSYRDTFTFEKKSFLSNNSMPPNSNELFSSASFSNARPQSKYRPTGSVPLATSRINTSTNTSHIDQYKSIQLNLQPHQQDALTSTAYNQHFNYVGAEPHISERIKTYNGAFGPKQEEITQAYKAPAHQSPNNNNYRLSAAANNSSAKLELPTISGLSQSQSQLLPQATPVNSNYMYGNMDDRPKIRSYDFRPVWIPKKYPGRNMFYSHLDSAIFPGKYDPTEQVWNSLTETNETARHENKSNSVSKIDQLINNTAKTEYQHTRVPGFTKNSGFIINPVDKSILPVMKTDHVRAAEVTKTNKFIDNSLYHYS